MLLVSVLSRLHVGFVSLLLLARNHEAHSASRAVKDVVRGCVVVAVVHVEFLWHVDCIFFAIFVSPGRLFLSLLDGWQILGSCRLGCRWNAWHCARSRQLALLG